jgi:hypothetical protein
MTEISSTPGWRPRAVHDLLADPGSRGVLIAASRDPDAKLTFIVTPPSGDPGGHEPVAVKIPATPAAGAAVEREGRMLAALRDVLVAPVAGTVPRFVEARQVDGRPVLVSTAMPGTPMSVPYHRWLHTARARSVAADFTLARDWLAAFQATTRGPRELLDWPDEVCDSLSGRWDGHASLPAALARVQSAARATRRLRCARTAVHGDFWFGNLLVTDGRITGVVDWEHGEPAGSPLRDLARFALSYCLYLDRHTRTGHRVLGHPGLRRTGFAPGLSYALLGEGWLPRLFQAFLRDGLTGLELPAALWYHVALTGIGEVAALANDDDFGAGHLELLAGLPLPAQRRWSW